MKKFKLVETTTKKVVASLNVEECGSLRANIAIINSWVKDMSNNNIEAKITIVNKSGAYKVVFPSTDSSWWVERCFVNQELRVWHSTKTMEIVPDDDTDILRELKEKVMRGEL